MPLNQLKLQLSYRTGRGDMVKDLFVPCLEQSILYRRAAGYFTSFELGLAARGIASLASRKGTMRLVASPHLEAGDFGVTRDVATSISKGNSSSVSPVPPLCSSHSKIHEWVGLENYFHLPVAVATSQ